MMRLAGPAAGDGSGSAKRAFRKSINPRERGRPEVCTFASRSVNTSVWSISASRNVVWPRCWCSTSRNSCRIWRSVWIIVRCADWAGPLHTPAGTDQRLIARRQVRHRANDFAIVQVAIAPRQPAQRLQNTGDQRLPSVQELLRNLDFREH